MTYCRSFDSAQTQHRFSGNARCHAGRRAAADDALFASQVAHRALLRTAPPTTYAVATPRGCASPAPRQQARGRSGCPASEPCSGRRTGRRPPRNRGVCGGARRSRPAVIYLERDHRALGLADEPRAATVPDKAHAGRRVMHQQYIDRSRGDQRVDVVARVVPFGVARQIARPPVIVRRAVTATTPPTAIGDPPSDSSKR